MKRPAFQFYPADWLQDTGLRACSLGARGLYIDMLCYMHQGNPYGHLTLPASQLDQKDILRPILPSILARMVGSTTEVVEELMAELEFAGVFSRTADGVIYSRRMVRDERLREIRAAGGVESLNNPNVPRPKHGPKSSKKDTFTGSLTGSFGGSPSSSSSSSSAIQDISSKPETPVANPLVSEPAGSDDTELPRTSSKSDSEAVRAVFQYYIENTQRDPRTYSLTRHRMQKGTARLAECRRKTGDDAKAVELMKLAIDGLVKSDWHMGRDSKTNGKRYCEWETHLFGSYERMERWWTNEA